jgi:hypothetical protein
MLHVKRCRTHSYSLRYAGPCPHGVARSRVADGGDGLQMRKVAANILNKQ